MKTWMIVLLPVAMMACASNKPIIDTKGVDMVRYQQDVVECEQYVDQVQSQAGKSAAGGAILGGAVSAIGGNSDSVARGSAVGAIVGLFKGGAQTRAEKAKVVKACLKQRGYRVLN